MPTLTQSEMTALALSVGFPASVAPTMGAIGMAESGGNTQAVHTNSNGSVDKGVWQINSVNSDVINKYGGNPLNPTANAQMALAIYKRQGLQAWSTYTSGAYLKYTNKGGSDSAANVPASFWNDLKDPQWWGALGNGLGGSGVPGTGLVPDPGNEGILGGLSGIVQALQTLTSAATWERIGLVLAGAVLVVIGIIAMIGSNREVRTVGKVAALA